MWNFSDVVPWLTRTRDDVPGDRLPVSDARGVLIHRDNGGDVLLVAHLDWIGETARRPPAPRVEGMIVRHPALDDRLGCWAIEQLAPLVGADLLFTDCEETGMTTASEFRPAHRRYRCIVSLDRMGTDAVLYQYASARRWSRAVRRMVGPVGAGSFSCIGALDHLGVCAVNLGVGYHDHNGPDCWADLRLTGAQLDRAVSFITHAKRRRWGFEAPRWPRVTVSRAPVNGAAPRFERVSLLDAPARRAADRLCVTCSFAALNSGDDGPRHHFCPMVADCWCCAAEADLESRYAWR